jgi:prepilin-type N-terminal cleavage/methylation domain-containing protein
MLCLKQATSHKPQATSHKPQATSHKPQATSHKPQATSHKPQAFKLGFTLSELLVSLAVLGLIAGLTVPSIVTSIEKTKTKAMAKSLLQATAEFFHTAYLNGELTDGADGYLLDTGGVNHPLMKLAIQRMNPTTVCDSNKVSAACTPPDGDYYFRTSPKLIFADGSVLTFHYKDNEYICLFVDYNGFKAGPNFTFDQQHIPANANLSDRNYIFFNPTDTTVWNCKPGMLCPAVFYPHTKPIWDALFNS